MPAEAHGMRFGCFFLDEDVKEWGKKEQDKIVFLLYKNAVTRVNLLEM